MLPTTFRTRKFDMKSIQDSFHKKAFNEFWPECKTWYLSKKPDAANSVLIKKAEQQLSLVMPEMMPIYESFRETSNDCPVAANFLTGYQPPAYLVSCSQAILNNGQPLLIRNYDLSPALSENLITHSNFMGQAVIGTNECLWGLDDGMNNSGLAASLTFGGSNKVGKGFGIPFIMRYVLETCHTVKQAIKVLQRVPSHMAYNITLLDKSGDFATVMVAPDQEAIVTRERCITNHQQQITWPEQARFSKTLERKEYLDDLLENKSLEKSKIIESFLNKPLRSNKYAQQFGTVFTAVYQPEQGSLEYHWPDEKPLTVSFKQFIEQDKTVDLAAQSSKSPINLISASVINQDDHFAGSFDNYFDNSSTFGNQSQAYSNAAIGIPLEIRESLLMSLEYISPVTEKQDSAISKLKKLLSSDNKISWVEYGNSLAII